MTNSIDNGETNNNSPNDENQNIQDLEKKYDIAIEVSRENYNSYIDLLHQVDEKSNKYLIFIGAIFAYIVAILPSNLLDKVTLSSDKADFKFTLSWIWLVCILISLCFSVTAAKSLLNSFEFIESYRMPSMTKFLKEKRGNSVYFKGATINQYENCVDKLAISYRNKQEKIKNVPRYVRNSILWLLVSTVLIFTLKNME